MLDYQESEIGNTLDDWFSRIHPGDVERIKMEILKHLAQLKDLNCQFGQGYFFSKPVDSQSATTLLLSKHIISAPISSKILST